MARHRSNKPSSQLNKSQSLPLKSVTEYSLPAARETHEIIAVNDNLLLISQQTDGSLVKVVLDDNGRPTGSSKWQLTTPFSGLHGLVLGDSNTTVWATAQFDNVVLQINPGENDINSAPTVVSTIPIPSPASGPHGILVNNGNLWVACKDSSHVVRINITDTSDTTCTPSVVVPSSSPCILPATTSTLVWTRVAKYGT
jgi:virginiamycin B lyase